MENFNTKEIIAVLLKNKKAILIVVILGAMISTIASFLLKPKYKSYAVVYPVNLSPSSEESNTEQLLQYFNSEEVMHAVAKKNNLLEHYGVDTSEAGAKSLFKFYFSENVKISPTLYESIEIEVKDESPLVARDIVQSLIEATNDLVYQVRRDRLEEYIVNSSIAIKNEYGVLDSLSSKINDLRLKYNIIDVGAQAKYLSKKAIGEKKPLNDADKTLWEGLKTKNSEIEKMYGISQGEIKTLVEFNDQKAKYLFDYNSKISYCNVVSKPTHPDKKCIPVRWIIVTVSTLSAFALACLFFILTFKSVRKVD